jgi:hypothetical protein
MASYGTFITACGFTYHGPKHEIGFAPKMSADNFKAAFTTAEGWGTYSQTRKGKNLECKIDVKWGKLMLRTVNLDKAGRATKIDLKSLVEITPGNPLVVTI